MTTIAYRDGILAGDGRETDVSDYTDGAMVVRDNLKKVHRLKDGRLFAAAGSSEAGTRLLIATQNGQSLPKLEDMTAIMIDRDGRIWLFEGNMWVQHRAPYYAIGSGNVCAMCAMDAGADAITAAKIGARRDPFSGGKVSWVKLVRPVPLRRQLRRRRA